MLPQRLFGVVVQMRNCETHHHACDCREMAFAKMKDERDKWRPVVIAAVALVCAPAWAGVSDEDIALEAALRDAGLVTPNVQVQG